MHQAERIVHERDEAEAAGGPGAEAVLVSHQLPIWVTRLAVEGRPLWHDPRKRRCDLSSITTVERVPATSSGRFTEVGYADPAHALRGSAVDEGAV